MLKMVSVIWIARLITIMKAILLILLNLIHEMAKYHGVILLYKLILYAVYFNDITTRTIARMITRTTNIRSISMTFMTSHAQPSSDSPLPFSFLKCNNSSSVRSIVTLMLVLSTLVLMKTVSK